jgi:hypothetical protein
MKGMCIIQSLPKGSFFSGSGKCLVIGIVWSLDLSCTVVFRGVGVVGFIDNVAIILS